MLMSGGAVNTERAAIMLVDEFRASKAGAHFTGKAGRRMNEALFAYDEAVRARNAACLCGVDEAGRGPLCGPVCAGAVILDRAGDVIEGVNDSKKLSEKKREALFP